MRVNKERLTKSAWEEKGKKTTEDMKHDSGNGVEERKPN